jgi:hypothetical protein
MKLKKEEDLEKMMSSMPSQIIGTDIQKKVAEKKPTFDHQEIEDHNRKYWELKEKNKKEKEEKAKLLKQQQQHQSNPLKYAPNKWSEQLEEEDHKRKEEERELSERKTKQLQARIKYGELVKNSILAKKKEKKPEPPQEEGEHKDQVPKPKTPQNHIQLPNIKSESSRLRKIKVAHDSSVEHITKSKKTVLNYKGS